MPITTHEQQRSDLLLKKLQAGVATPEEQQEASVQFQRQQSQMDQLQRIIEMTYQSLAPLIRPGRR